MPNSKTKATPLGNTVIHYLHPQCIRSTSRQKYHHSDHSMPINRGHKGREGTSAAGRQAEAKHELTALFSRETGQKDKAQSVRAMYIETATTCTTPALPTNGLEQRLRACLSRYSFFTYVPSSPSASTIPSSQPRRRFGSAPPSSM